MTFQFVAKIDEGQNAPANSLSPEILAPGFSSKVASSRNMSEPPCTRK